MESGDNESRNESEDSDRARLLKQVEERHRQRLTKQRQLLEAIRASLNQIDALVGQLDALEEGGVYKYYGQSFKVFALQTPIEQAQALFGTLAPPEAALNDWFLSICAAALEHKFSLLDRTCDWGRMNDHWQVWTRPILEAFWHCSFFLRAMARYGRELEEPPIPWSPATPDASPTPAGWLAVLALYGLAW
jgi:hypothetical protein